MERGKESLQGWWSSRGMEVDISRRFDLSIWMID